MTSPTRIHALPLHLANQIAAGEVIERPASVVKELVENSLDAGATEIHIHIENAGNKLIQVRDNGIGIHPDDLALALSRHATSKLNSSEQLSQIASLGFRGEALPSIASISQLTLDSKQAEQEHGWQLTLETEPTPSNHPNGTTISIRDLFFNVPARRHFLRSEKTELNHITTTIHRLALSQFHTGFFGQLSANQQLRLPQAITLEQRQQRIAKICGKAFLKNSLYLEQEYDDLHLTGWIANQQGHRPQTDIHFFFINGRVIRDRVINHAIRQAYIDLIPEGRYPAFVLYLTMPFDRVDINVHPTKHEVRFRDARLIHGLITNAIRDALLAQPNEAETTDLFQTPSQSHIGETEHVSEQAASYRSTPTRQTKPTIAAPKPSILIAERYIILEQPHCALLDLQIADLQLRQQAFQTAIETETLSTRPILVPIQFKLTESDVALLSSYQHMLSQLGFDYHINGQQLVINHIPSLLAHCPLKDLIAQLTQTLTPQTTQQQLQQFLIEQLPLIPIQSLEHANTILQQLTLPAHNTSWHRILDNTTLEQLFTEQKGHD